MSVNVATLAVSNLKPSERNARTHGPEQVEQVKRSIEEFGFTNPVVIDSGTVVAGHCRRLAALAIYAEGGRIYLPPGRARGGAQLPPGTVPTLDCSGWSEAQRRAYLIADNKLSDNSTWDSMTLAAEVAALEALAFDTELLGFDPKDIVALNNIFSESEKAAFAPKLNPTSQPSDVVEKNLNAEYDKQGKKFAGAAGGGVEVTCPHCGEDFEVNVDG